MTPNALEEIANQLEKSWTEALRPLKTLVFKKALLYTCSITWAFGKKSGSSFHFPPTSETGSAISWRKTKIIGENLNTRLETVAITGVQKSDSVHLLHKNAPNGGFFRGAIWKSRTRNIGLTENKEIASRFSEVLYLNLDRCYYLKAIFLVSGNTIWSNRLDKVLPGPWKKPFWQ